jgi:hypothetical protein
MPLPALPALGLFEVLEICDGRLRPFVSSTDNSPKARRHSQVHWRIPIQINDSRGPPLFKTKRRLLAGGMERTGYCIAEEGWTTERVGTPDIQVAYGKINILSEDRWYQLIPSVIVISLILNQRVQGSSPCAPTKSKRSFGIRACGNRCANPGPPSQVFITAEDFSGAT